MEPCLALLPLGSLLWDAGVVWPAASCSSQARLPCYEMLCLLWNYKPMKPLIPQVALVRAFYHKIRNKTNLLCDLHVKIAQLLLQDDMKINLIEVTFKSTSSTSVVLLYSLCVLLPSNSMIIDKTHLWIQYPLFCSIHAGQFLRDAHFHPAEA